MNDHKEMKDPAGYAVAMAAAKENDESQTFKLRPCPFCGAEGELVINHSGKMFYIFVRCTFCHAQAKISASKSLPPDGEELSSPAARTAVTGWNLRSGK